MSRSRATLTSIILLGFMLFAGTAHGSIMVDQNNGFGGVDVFNRPGSLHWQQEITSGMTGTLSFLSLNFAFLDNTGHTAQTLNAGAVAPTINILKDDGSYNFQSVASFNFMPTQSGEYKLDLQSFGIQLQQYEMFLVDVFNPSKYLGLGYTTNDRYSNGYLYEVDASGFPINNLSLNDTMNLAFQTQVNAVPIPGAVWLLGSGLVGLAGLRRRIFG